LSMSASLFEVFSFSSEYNISKRFQVVVGEFDQ
jgi:hypothetical protein